MTFTQLLALVGSSKNKPRVVTDSQKISQGDCFVAIAGTRFDGHDFIDQALKNGAAYIVSAKPLDCPGGQLIVVPDTESALGELAQAYYDNPAGKMTNLAVTGTNGKTTVSYLVRSILNAADKKAALIGTVVYDAGSGAIPSTLTTPDPLIVASLAKQALDEGAEYLIIEASSHALDQNRLAGLTFTAAAFTNLTGDHLDYHKTAEQYLAAKTKLFTDLPPHAIAVLNADSPASYQIASQTSARKIWYSIEDADAQITAHVKSMDINQTVYSLQFNNYMEKVITPLPGPHNISNHLAAAGLCIAAGIDLSTIAIGLSALDCVPGRLEPVDTGQPFAVLVDYAHTDDALKNVLQTLQPLCKARLILVFGCGGDRDKTKRPRMARVAEQLADVIFVTSDNPRTEGPDQIIKDIAAGFFSPDSDNIIIQPDRKIAIESAIKIAKPNDIVLIAGKGHEDYQIIGTEKFDFDDRKIARACLGKN